MLLLPHSAFCWLKQILTAANLVRVVGAVHVVVALLVFANALAVGAGELVRGAAHCGTRTGNSVTSNRKYTLTTHHDSGSIPSTVRSEA